MRAARKFPRTPGKVCPFFQFDAIDFNWDVHFRAKLLHDAWNLAYAGDLSFATAFNMTLFMKYERDHLVWNPVFTFIDHIGRHIDMSNVHKKFEVNCLNSIVRLLSVIWFIL